MAELMTFNETKSYLRTSKATLYKLLRGGKIPGFKVDERWRIDKEKLDKWMEEHENMNIEVKP